jgi:hypothetical protein
LLHKGTTASIVVRLPMKANKIGAEKTDSKYPPIASAKGCDPMKAPLKEVAIEIVNSL